MHYGKEVSRTTSKSATLKRKHEPQHTNTWSKDALLLT
jgi:hypothetical protein